MKKLLVSLLTLTMLTACGGSSSSTSKSETKETTGYVFETDGVEVVVGEKADDTLKALGDPVKKDVSASCAGVTGDDISYQYKDFKIVTFKEKGKDEVIKEVSILSDVVSTKEGIEIGSSQDDVEKAYGTDYKEKGSEHVYSKGDMTLSFIFDSAKCVSNIYYRAND